MLFRSYLGLRWGQKLDPLFHINDTPPPNPKEDDGNVTFDRDHIQYLVGGNSPLERTQVILMDEFHFGGGARSWQNKDQQKLVNLISAIRSKGFVLIIVVLNTKMVDVYVRDFVLNYQFAVTGRGKAIAYRRWFPEGATEAHRKRLGTMDMRLPDQDLCNSPDCFKCNWLHASKNKRCETIRAIYERRKKWFLDEQSKEDSEEIKSEWDSFEKVLAKASDAPNNKKMTTQQEWITWFKESGFKIRWDDQRPYAKKILRLLKEGRKPAE